MPRRVSLQFSTAGPSDAARFIEEYVLDSLERVPTTDACDAFTFVPGQPTTGDRTEGLLVPPPDHPVYLTIRGDTDAIIAAERDRWDSYVDDGTVTGWEPIKTTDTSEMVEELGEERTALLARSSHLAARMAGLAYGEFEALPTVPAAVETYPEEASDAAPFGWWTVLHTLTVALNYSMTEELDAYRYGIEHALRNVAEYEGGAAAEARLDELIAALEGLRDEVTEGRLDT